MRPFIRQAIDGVNGSCAQMGADVEAVSKVSVKTTVWQSIHPRRIWYIRHGPPQVLVGLQPVMALKKT